MIDRMASDIGISQFTGEPLPYFKCRVVYSAMACWIKAIALDKPVGCQAKEIPGVSRRHIYERSHTILTTIITMTPEIKEWFEMSSDNDDPVNIIRTRLLNHGDLLNAGFNTNLALSSVHSDQKSPAFEAVYGKIIGDGIRYSGVASIRNKEVNSFVIETEDVKKWMHSYVNDVLWSYDLPDLCQVQYFNPSCAVKNNFEAWQESIDGLTGKIILIKSMVNKNSYSYYLLRPKEKLVHRIDPFLQEQGFHIRVMCALRSLSCNKTVANVTNYCDHIKIRFNAFLPLKERIMIESYAWPVRYINDKLEWIMEAPVWDYIRPYLEALDIQITEEIHG